MIGFIFDGEQTEFKSLEDGTLFVDCNNNICIKIGDAGFMMSETGKFILDPENLINFLCMKGEPVFPVKITFVKDSDLTEKMVDRVIELDNLYKEKRKLEDKIRRMEDFYDLVEDY